MATLPARRNNSFQQGVALALLLCAAVAALFVYGLRPFARLGLSYESDAERAAAAMEKARIIYSSSDWVLAEGPGGLLVSPLTPALARRLAGLRVPVVPLRDLPGLLPILFLACVGLAGLYAGRGGDGPATRHRVLLLLVAAAGVEFYLWVWTVAADFDLTTPGLPVRKGAARRGPSDTRIDHWFKSLVVQVPVWLAAMAVLCKLVWDSLGRAFVTMLVAAFYLALAGGVVVMFRSDPYFRLPALSWWPLLFTLSLLLCGVACVRAAHRLAARTQEVTDESGAPV